MKSIVAKYLSHNIRSPLNTATVSLICAKSNMESSASENSETYDMLCDAYSSCNVISGVLDNIVTYEALTTGTLQLFPKACKGQEIVKKAIEPHKLAVSETRSNTISVFFSKPITVIVCMFIS